MGQLRTYDGTKEHRACWEIVKSTGQRDPKPVQFCPSAFGEMPRRCLGGIKVAYAETMSKIVLKREGFRWSWVCIQACALPCLIY